MFDPFSRAFRCIAAFLAGCWQCQPDTAPARRTGTPLTGSVVRGVAHTAPFSPWSFGYYLSQALPLICLGELFFLAFFFSKEERLLRPLTQATPIRQRRYAALRCGAVLTATLVLCLCVAVLAVGFYVSLFGWVDYGELILPALLTLIPRRCVSHPPDHRASQCQPAISQGHQQNTEEQLVPQQAPQLISKYFIQGLSIVFCLGAGMMLSRFNHTLIYALMAAVILLTVLPLPPAINFSLSDFFQRYTLLSTERLIHRN